MKDENKKDYKKIRELQLCELEILKCFDDICKKNDIRFYFLGGTFLGAVRHKGFIPWDDDVDLGVPRQDYEKLCSIIDNNLPSNYVFKNFKKGNEDTIYFSRIEDLNRVITDNSAIKNRQRYAWIDIFPLDGMPNNVILRSIHKFRLLFNRLLMQYANFSTVVNQDLPNRPFHEKILIDIGNVIKPDRFLNAKKYMYKIDSLLKKYDYDNSVYVGNHMGAYKFKEMFKKELYDNAVLYEFEDQHYYAPKDYDYVLTQMYGDYMQSPEDKDKFKHHVSAE